MQELKFKNQGFVLSMFQIIENGTQPQDKEKGTGENCYMRRATNWLGDKRPWLKVLKLRQRRDSEVCNLDT